MSDAPHARAAPGAMPKRSAGMFVAPHVRAAPGAMPKRSAGMFVASHARDALSHATRPTSSSTGLIAIRLRGGVVRRSGGVAHRFSGGGGELDGYAIA